MLLPVLVSLGILMWSPTVVGPWVTSALGGIFTRTWRRPATLLAGRRLRDDPKAAYRASAGVVLAVFAGSMALTLMPSLESEAGYYSQFRDAGAVLLGRPGRRGRGSGGRGPAARALRARRARGAGRAGRAARGRPVLRRGGGRLRVGETRAARHGVAGLPGRARRLPRLAGAGVRARRDRRRRAGGAGGAAARRRGGHRWRRAGRGDRRPGAVAGGRAAARREHRGRGRRRDPGDGADGDARRGRRARR